MKIHLATDHAGFEHKEVLKTVLTQNGYTCIDHGNVVLDPADDYPIFMQSVAEALVASPADFAAVFGGSGSGEAMVLNRTHGVRAIAYYGGNEEIVRLSREHNNANALAIGARFASPEESVKIVLLWLNTPFSGEDRHVRRLNQF